MSKYLYTPCDIAKFFIWADFTRSYEIYIRDLIWKDGNIKAKYRKDKRRFIRDIERALEQIDDENYFDEVESINNVLWDVGSGFTIENIVDEETTIHSFFRMIKLKLTYHEETTYVRMKVRTILKNFNYKRRHPVFIKKLKKAMNAMGIVTYLKGFEICDIAEIKINDMVIMRLK